MIDVRVTGAADLQRLSRRLKAVNGRELQKELRTGIVKATKPMKADAKANARSVLPKRGGLNERVAKATLTTRVNARGVRIVAKKNAKTGLMNLYTMNQGRLRHPVYADQSKTRSEWHWVDQAVHPGWFTDAMEKNAPIVRKEIRAAMERIERKVR